MINFIQVLFHFSHSTQRCQQLAVNVLISLNLITMLEMKGPTLEIISC